MAKVNFSRMKNLTLLVIFSFIGLGAGSYGTSDMHKYYFSKMTIEKNEKAKSLEVVFRLFSDDLENAIGGSEDNPIRLGDDREIQEADELIFNYLTSRVDVEGIGWENAVVSYIGKEVDNDVTKVYMEYTEISEWDKITIENNIMFELFEGQINEVTLIRGKEVETHGAYEGQPFVTFDLTE